MVLTVLDGLGKFSMPLVEMVLIEAGRVGHRRRQYVALLFLVLVILIFAALLLTVGRADTIAVFERGFSQRVDQRQIDELALVLPKFNDKIMKLATVTWR